ncbi:MAG: hypothetical protein E8D43_04605 [Nitrospira sp.]|nr:MAG: hypothetical protein E8D43_04605 [Nitrospira sp.]
MIDLRVLGSQPSQQVVLPRFQTLGSVYGLIDIAAQGRDVLLAQRHDFLVLTSPGLSLLLRLLLDSTLQFTLRLFQVSLLRHTSRQQGQPRRDQHEHTESGRRSFATDRSEAPE